jgi:hypothetical protein
VKLIGKIPTYTTAQVHVYEDEGEVVMQIVGARGGVQAAVRLADFGVEQLDKLTHRALNSEEERSAAERRDWVAHSRLASEPEGRDTGLHRDSMG